MTPETPNTQVETNEQDEPKKHFLEEGFNELGQYEVQKEDGSETLYSIMNESISRNISVENRTILRKTFLENIEQVDAINKGDIIEINQIDNNSYEISIGENLYVVNIFNESFVKISNNKIKKEEKN